MSSRFACFDYPLRFLFFGLLVFGDKENGPKFLFIIPRCNVQKECFDRCASTHTEKLFHILAVYMCRGRKFTRNLCLISLFNSNFVSSFSYIDHMSALSGKCKFTSLKYSFSGYFKLNKWSRMNFRYQFGIGYLMIR